MSDYNYDIDWDDLGGESEVFGPTELYEELYGIPPVEKSVVIDEENYWGEWRML